MLGNDPSFEFKRSRFIARNTNEVGGAWRSCSSYLCALLHEHMTFRSRMAVAQCAMGQIRSRGRGKGEREMERNLLARFSSCGPSPEQRQTPAFQHTWSRTNFGFPAHTCLGHILASKHTWHRANLGLPARMRPGQVLTLPAHMV